MSSLPLSFFRFGSTLSTSAIVFVHGHTSSKETWNVIKEQFNSFDCIAVDLRGHGHSPMPEDDDFTIESCVNDIRSLVLSEIDTKKNLFLVGHSMGGRIVVPYAAAYPTEVSGVIIEDMDMQKRDTSQHTTISNEEKNQLKMFDRQFSTLEDCKASLLTYGYPESYVDRWIKTDRISTNDKGYWCAIHPWTSHQCLAHILSSDGLPSFSTLSMDSDIPVLLLLADNHSVTSDEGVVNMRKEMKRIQIFCVNNSDHSIHRVQRDHFVAFVTQFITRSVQ